MKKSSIILLITSSLSLIACLPPSHHFDGAEILKPGVHRNTLGISYPERYYNYLSRVRDSFKVTATDSAPWINIQCDKGMKNCYKKTEDKINISYRWQLGALDSLWIFPGLQYGFELQTPFSMEFSSGLGLPSPSPHLRHSLGLGWALGAWADNSWWAEYSIGNAPTGPWHYYLSQRLTYMASPKGDVNFTKGDFNDHHQTFRPLSALGLNYNTGAKDSWTPSVIHLQIYHQWFELPTSGLNWTHSAAYLGFQEAWNLKPTFAMGLSWN